MNQNSSARWVNIVVGLWLFVSAFLWPHTPWQFGNTWIVGAIAVVIAGFATRAPQLRFVNAALAVWLFISVWAMPDAPGTFWNNLLASIVIFISALTPSTQLLRLGRPTSKTATSTRPPTEQGTTLQQPNARASSEQKGQESRPHS